jgi:hypothetical protein
MNVNGFYLTKLRAIQFALLFVVCHLNPVSFMGAMDATRLN